MLATDGNRRRHEIHRDSRREPSAGNSGARPCLSSVNTRQCRAWYRRSCAALTGQHRAAFTGIRRPSSARQHVLQYLPVFRRDWHYTRASFKTPSRRTWAARAPRSAKGAKRRVHGLVRLGQPAGLLAPGNEVEVDLRCGRGRAAKSPEGGGGGTHAQKKRGSKRSRLQPSLAETPGPRPV